VIIYKGFGIKTLKYFLLHVCSSMGSENSMGLENTQIVEMLMSAGITQNEARTYIALLGLGEAQTGVLCDKLKIPSSHIYRILASLHERGLVSYKYVNNIKVFKANDPETLNVLYMKKQEELEKQRITIQDSIKKLKVLPSAKEALSDYKYFEGMSGIKAMWLEIKELMKPDTESVILTAKVEGFERLHAFYMEHEKARARKGIKERLIYPAEGKKYSKDILKLKHTEVRYMDSGNEAEFGVYSGFMFMQYLNGKTPRSFLIKDRIFAQTFMSIFNNLWKQAKE